MRAASPALIAFLQQNNEFRIADLYTFTLTNGVVLRLTTWDRKIKVSGNTFLASGPYVERSTVKRSVGLDVDQVTVSLKADIAHTIMGMPILQALAQGWFRGARLIVQRLFLGNIAQEPLHWFSGQVSAVEIDRLSASIVAVSDLYVFDVKMPRNVTQPGCRHQIYEAGCDVVKASFANASTMQAGSSTLIVVAPNSGNFATDGYFEQGVFLCTSGANNGLKRTVKKHSGAKLYFHVPLPFAVNTGDSFTAYPGCDKLMGTCDSKFSNLANFGGEPFTPKPETTL